MVGRQQHVARLPRPSASGEPEAVMTMTVAPWRCAISATSTRSRLRPGLLMTTAQSPGPSIGGARHLHVAVAHRMGAHAQAEELVLGILRDDAGVAHAVELDAPAAATSLCQQVDRTLQGAGCSGVAVPSAGAHGVVDHLDDELARAVVLVHRAVHEGHALADAARSRA
jgi:hypothetical protein